MTPEKIKSIIAEENERSERQTAEDARCLIRSILTKEAEIKELQAEIVEARAKLKSLSVSAIDETSILG